MAYHAALCPASYSRSVEFLENRLCQAKGVVPLCPHHATAGVKILFFDNRKLGPCRLLLGLAPYKLYVSYDSLAPKWPFLRP